TGSSFRCRACPSRPSAFPGCPGDGGSALSRRESRILGSRQASVRWRNVLQGRSCLACRVPGSPAIMQCHRSRYYPCGYEVREGWLANRSRAAAEVGGARGSRTPDLVNAIHALSQLSYGPNSQIRSPFWVTAEALSFLLPSRSTRR